MTKSKNLLGRATISWVVTFDGQLDHDDPIPAWYFTSRVTRFFSSTTAFPSMLLKRNSYNTYSSEGYDLGSFKSVNLRLLQATENKIKILNWYWLVMQFVRRKRSDVSRTDYSRNSYTVCAPYSSCNIRYWLQVDSRNFEPTHGGRFHRNDHRSKFWLPKKLMHTPPYIFCVHGTIEISAKFNVGWSDSGIR